MSPEAKGWSESSAKTQKRTILERFPKRYLYNVYTRFGHVPMKKTCKFTFKEHESLDPRERNAMVFYRSSCFAEAFMHMDRHSERERLVHMKHIKTMTSKKLLQVLCWQCTWKKNCSVNTEPRRV